MRKTNNKVKHSIKYAREWIDSSGQTRKIWIHDVWIYALCEPDTKAIRYIGQSIKPYQRLKDHEKTGTIGIRLWIHNLKMAGKKPKILILEKADYKDRHKREFEWIQTALRAGEDLFNQEAYHGNPIKVRSQHVASILVEIARQRDQSIDNIINEALNFYVDSKYSAILKTLKQGF